MSSVFVQFACSCQLLNQYFFCRTLRRLHGDACREPLVFDLYVALNAGNLYTVNRNNNRKSLQIIIHDEAIALRMPAVVFCSSLACRRKPRGWMT